MRERLIELIAVALNEYHDYSNDLRRSGIPVYESIDEYVASYLLANGVIVPPCKVGDTIYALQKERSGHFEGNKYVVDDEGEWEVCEKEFNLSLLDAVGEWIFLTREEAEQALKGGAD